jgi:hypothetical protein
MGIETPDVDSLAGINKEQNTRTSLVESCHKITKAGLQIMSGFILGFDGEKPGAGKRIQEFVEETCIPQAHLNLLQALPNTAMWTRLQKEGRLIDGLGEFLGSQKALMNFVPTRPISEIADEFIETFWNLYEPMPYLKRTFKHFMMMEGWRAKYQRTLTKSEIQFLMSICWRQGVLGSTRFVFWQQLITMVRLKPNLLYDYLIALGVGEHFFKFRHEVREEIESELAELQQHEQNKKATILQLETVS